MFFFFRSFFTITKPRQAAPPTTSSHQNMFLSLVAVLSAVAHVHGFAAAARMQPLACTAASRHPSSFRMRFSPSIKNCDADDEDTVREPPIKAGDIGGKIFDALFLVWTAIIQFFGGLLGIGIILNLCGFGYRYTLFPPSVDIKPLAEMRQETTDRRFLIKAAQYQDGRGPQ